MSQQSDEMGAATRSKQNERENANPCIHRAKPLVDDRGTLWQAFNSIILCYVAGLRV